MGENGALTQSVLLLSCLRLLSTSDYRWALLHLASETLLNTTTKFPYSSAGLNLGQALQQVQNELGVVAHAYNPSTGEPEAGGLP